MTRVFLSPYTGKISELDLQGRGMRIRSWLMSVVLVASSLWCLALVWHARQLGDGQDERTAHPSLVTREVDETHHVSGRSPVSDGQPQG